MKRNGQLQVAVFLGLVAMGAGLRISLQDLPNFAPVAGIALFAGYFFSRRALALATPLLVMGVSDFFIGSYHWQMMLIVYSMLLLPALFGPPLRRALASSSVWRPTGTLLCCSLGASLAFFAVTNFGAWVWFDTYAHSWDGLVACYVAALPFFRYTLAGDLGFATLLFGTYACVRSIQASSWQIKPLGSES